MTRQRLSVGAKRIAVATPYHELSKRHDSRIDRALLAAWGQLSPRLLSVLEQRRLRRFVKNVEGREKTLAVTVGSTAAPARG